MILTILMAGFIIFFIVAIIFTPVPDKEPPHFEEEEEVETKTKVKKSYYRIYIVKEKKN